MTAEDALMHHFLPAWVLKSAPAKTPRRRRRVRRPAWAETLLVDRDATVVFEQPIPCPSCGGLATGLEGGRGEVDDGGPLDVIRCDACLAPVVLDLRAGTIRPPTEAERRRWRVTFWFVVMRDSSGD